MVFFLANQPSMWDKGNGVLKNLWWNIFEVFIRPNKDITIHKVLILFGFLLKKL
jgi:hypothetical protein